MTEIRSAIMDNQEQVYCIACEKMTHIEQMVCGEGHIVYIYPTDELPPDVDCCEFPHGYVSCPPPEEPEAPDEWVKAPDEPEVPYLEREPYREDLLEYHAQTMQEEAELLVEMMTQEV